MFYTDRFHRDGIWQGTECGEFMSKLRFIFGPSGSGKTKSIYKELLERAAANPNTNYLIVVPDQFTMQTQWDISNCEVDGVPAGGIMNIDVLSFGRLHHRIMAEVGWKEVPVLDDTGKCLVLQRVAGRIEDKLPLLGSRLRRQGYIHEIKSVLSEFMQYGISPTDIDRIIEANSDKKALCTKLKDLQEIYRSFQEYTAGNFITREEKLDILREALPKSALLPGSVIVFDGFTGFTPIQANVVEDIMAIADETIVSLVLGKETAIEETTDEQNLFYLSGKTYRNLCERAKSRGVEIGESQYCDFDARVPVIRHIEQNLFRTGSKVYKPDDGIYPGLTMSQMSTVAEEVHQVGLSICNLIKDTPGMQYRNIVLVTGDPETYAPYVEREFRCLGIPYFLDRTSGIRLNPLVEAIRSCLSIYIENFSADSVIRYLRSGLAGFEPEEVDRLELYIKKTGIRGYKKWSMKFAKKSDDMSPEDEAALAAVEATRESLMNRLEEMGIKSKDTAAGYVNKLYDFLLSLDAAGQLNKYADEFEKAEDVVRQREYSQIYKKVIELLEQVITLMGDDELALKEFYDILDAGFGEIRVGTIPQTVDKVMVGDIERSRIPTVEAMYFLGVNDGNIPRNTDKGGILSDIDRENLRDTDFELAPTPREAMYTQRMYLYMNMTKPVRVLNLSWASLDPSGKSLRHSYICDLLKKMFPGIKVDIPEERAVSEQIVSAKQGIRYLSDGLRRFVEVGAADEDRDVFTLYEAYSDANALDIRDKLADAAFIRYRPEKIDELIAEQLYCAKDKSDAGDDETDDIAASGDDFGTAKSASVSGDTAELLSSVSQLETFGQCPYRFFLQYGLKLKAPYEFTIGSLEKGNVYHEVLEKFSKGLKDDKIGWNMLTEAEARRRIHELTLNVTDIYGDAVFQDNERSRYSIGKIEEMLLCTVLTLKHQFSKGNFEPIGYEVPFRHTYDIKSAANGRKRRLRLRGKIDRVDKAVGEGGAYIRIVDYKSGNKNIDLKQVYDGQQLQLALYAGNIAEREKAIPAAMLYYHVDNPLLDYAKDETDEERENRRFKQLRMKGIVADDSEIVTMCDADLANPKVDSDVIPVKTTKDSTYDSRSGVLPIEDIGTVIDYANEVAKDRAGDILDGNIQIQPLQGKSCTYCDYRKSCGFDRKIPGYEERVPINAKNEEILQLMREKLSGN